VVELANGYEIHLGADEGAVRAAEELAVLERRCCPFLKIALRDAEIGGDMVLEVSGDRGAKEFIALEVGIVDAQGGRAG
jgi:hypothetical protein